MSSYLLRYAAALAGLAWLSRRTDSMYISIKQAEELGEILQSADSDVSTEVFDSATSEKRLERTVELMQKLIWDGARHPDVRFAAAGLVQECPSKDRKCEITQLFNFVKAKLRFLSDVFQVETLHKPERLMEMIRAGRGAGDCDDHVILLCSLLLSIGIPAQIVLASTSELKGFHHVYAAAEVTPRKWMYLDPSLKAERYKAGVEHEGIVKRKHITL